MTIYPLKAVRVLAVTAQGLQVKNGAEPPVTPLHIMQLIKQLGCIQIDTLQRVHRSHYLAIWSRLGSYPTNLLDALAYGGFDDAGRPIERQLFEYWYHAACLLPLERYRYRLARMRSAARGRHESTREWLARADTQRLLSAVTQRIEQSGAQFTRDFEDPRDERGSWWDWKPAKEALEHLYNRGDLMIARRVNFQRAYDLKERVLPDWVDTKAPSEAETAQHTLEQSALALGISELRHVADYCYDHTRPEASPFLQAMVAEGVIKMVKAKLADGEIHELAVHRDHIETLQRAADGDLKATRTTLLSPFDTLFYPQGRDQAFWGFRQILEAYKPASQRIWGYFCLPILDRGRLVGRLDPKLERKQGLLRIEALYLEPGIQPSQRLARSLARAIKDFIGFHQAQELVIEHSTPASFADRIMAEM